MPRDANCRACPLGGTGKTTCVWGRANLSPYPQWVDVMVVGEAPGQAEDNQGIPFVGPSGVLLEDALKQAGVTSYYKTNLVKCRPPGNRQPTPQEKNACRPYLEEEIAALKPRAILAVGAVAWQKLGGVGSVTEQAGKEIQSAKYGCPVMPIVHPAAILRNRNLEREWRATVARFGHLVNGTLLAAPPVTVGVADWKVLPPHAIADRLRIKGNFTFDFETNGLPWWHRDFVATTVAFSYDGKRAIAVPLWHPDAQVDPAWLRDFVAALTPVMADPQVLKTAHNMLFDDLVWYRISGSLPYTTFDTMVAWHLLNENSSKGLKYLGRVLLGWPDWGGGRHAPDLPGLLTYNGQDACATWLIRKEILTRLNEDRRLKVYLAKHLMPGLRDLEKLIARGIYADPTHLWKLQRELTAEAEAAAKLIPVENPGSTKQLAAWLYDREQLPILKKTDAGAPSTDEETINTLAEQGYTQAKVILDYRAPVKNLGTYVKPILRDRGDSFDGRIHPDYHIGPETGRLASGFHTTPRETRMRNTYSAPPGRVLVSADLKQVEARLVAWYAAGRPTDLTSQKPNSLLDLFVRDVDVYRVFAARVLEKLPQDIAKQERQEMGKVPVLAQLYNISADGLREYAWKKYQLRWGAVQARAIWATFRRTFPEISAWHERERRMLVARGWTQSLIGRKRRLPAAMDGYGKDASEAINAGINMPIQSLAWDITWAGLRAAQACGHDIVGTVHDSVLVECNDHPMDIASTANGLRIHMLTDSLDLLRPLGLRLPEGLLDVEIAVGPWGTDEKPEDYIRRKWPEKNPALATP